MGDILFQENDIRVKFNDQGIQHKQIQILDLSLLEECMDRRRRSSRIEGRMEVVESFSGCMPLKFLGKDLIQYPA